MIHLQTSVYKKVHRGTYVHSPKKQYTHFDKPYIMRENIYFYFMQTHVLFIVLSLVFLGHQLVAASGGGGGAANKCIDKERQALLDFIAHLQDPDGWLSLWRPEEEDDCCQWWGVTCSDQTGHVTELSLNEYDLEGEISLSLLNLTYLNYLDLSFNSFH